MSNERQTLTTALGMPLAWITTNDDQQILVTNEYGTIKTINQFITKFSYKYDDENGDECTIELAIPKVEDFDNKAFIADNILKVQWGYMLPNGTHIKSPKRIVVVRDINPSYSDEKMCIELVCTSMFDFTKRMASNHTVNSLTVFDFFRQAAAGKFIPTISVDGVLKLLHIDDKANMSYIHHGSGSKSLYAMWQRMVGILNDGPYHVEGQDDKAIIHKRNYNASAWASFTYAGGWGELISFKAKSNIAKTNADMTDMDFIDPETKEVKKENLVTQAQFGNNPTEINDADAKVAMDDWFSRAKWNLENPLDQVEMPTEVTVKHVVENSSIDWLGTNAKKPFYMKGFTPTTSYTTLYNKYTYSAVLQSPYAKSLERQNLIENYTKKKLERKFESDATVIGDPTLENRRVYKFHGLSKQDSGDWYCATAEHSITLDGYRVTLGLLRKPILLATSYEAKGKTFQQEWQNVKPFVKEDKTKEYKSEEQIMIEKRDRINEEKRRDRDQNGGVMGKIENYLTKPVYYDANTGRSYSAIDDMKTRVKTQSNEEDLFKVQLAENPEYKEGLTWLSRPNGKSIINSAEA